MTTLAAGGFSPHPASLAGYPSPAIEWIITVFMFVAGVNFALQVRVARGQRRVLRDDEEFRAYTGVVLVATGMLFLFLHARRHADRGSGPPRRLPGRVDHHDDGLRQRRLRVVEPAGAGGPAGR